MECKHENRTAGQSFVKQEKSIKQQEQIDLYNAYFEIHKRAMEIDRIVSELAAKKVFAERAENINSSRE